MLLELKEAVFDAEDLLDHIKTEATQNGSRRTSWASSSKVQQKDSLDLEAGPGHIISQGPPSTSSVEDSDVYGRNEDKETLIRLLLADDVDNKIGVIPIVGMGGMRKTTLAQFLYDDVGVRQHFELRAWVCVSEEFDVQTCGSKIIVTTRNERVASVMGTFEAHRLMQIRCVLLVAPKLTEISISPCMTLWLLPKEMHISISLCMIVT